MELTLGRHRDHRAAGHRGSGSRQWFEALGRIGLASRGAIYCIVAWLALVVAFGDLGREVDKQGAIATLASQPLGTWLLLILAACFAGYALWRAAEAITGETSKDSDAGAAKRAASAAKGVLYGAFAVSTLTFALSHRGESTADKQEGWTATVMGWSFGRQLVAVVGLVVIGIGLSNFYRAIKGTFMEKLKTNELGDRTESTVRTIGRAGHIGRGAVFTLVGVFVVKAAADFDPQQSRGLDGALKELAFRGYGPPLLVVLAVGMLAFALYSFCEARWRRILGS
jgi:hypothetical protein